METALKLWRVRAQRSADDVASHLGVTVAMWSRWENGRRKVPAERCLEVERVTGVSRYDLRPDVYGQRPAQAEVAP